MGTNIYCALDSLEIRSCTCCKTSREGVLWKDGVTYRGEGRGTCWTGIILIDLFGGRKGRDCDLVIMNYLICNLPSVGRAERSKCFDLSLNEHKLEKRLARAGS